MRIKVSGVVLLVSGMLSFSCSPSKYDFEPTAQNFRLEDHVEGDVVLDPVDPEASPSPVPSPSVSPPALPSPSPSVVVMPIDYRCGENLDKVYICHFPPGNPENAHTLCISEQGAVNGHGVNLMTGKSISGDYLGQCKE